jgi:acetyl-CoA synthetase
MSGAEETGGSLSEAQIAVHWREEEYLSPSTRFIGQANAADPAIYQRFSEDRFPDCFPPTRRRLSGSPSPKPKQRKP